MQVWARKKSGFTIVELLIVVVVIAILATITIVAYNGIQNQAKDSALRTSLTQAAHKTLAYAPLNNDAFPDESSYRSALALPADTASASYNYFVSDDRKSFCLSVTDTTSAELKAYASTQDGKTVPGTCVKNLVVNPSFEINTSGWSMANGATNAGSSSAAKIVGNNGVAVTTSSTMDSGIGRSYAFEAGKTYTLSCMFQSKASTNYIYKVSAQATGLPSAGTVNRILTPDQQARFASTWTMPSSATGQVYCLRNGGQSGTSTYNVDGVMLTETDRMYSYGDGDSDNWSWAGAAQNSMSFGPAVPAN